MKKFLKSCHNWLFMLIAMFAMSMSSMAQDATFKCYDVNHETQGQVSYTTSSGYDPYYGINLYGGTSFTITATADIEKVVLRDLVRYTKIDVAFTGATGHFEGAKSASEYLASVTWIADAECKSVRFTNEGDADFYVKYVDVYLKKDTPAGPDSEQTAYMNWKELVTVKMKTVVDEFCGGWNGAAPTEDVVGQKPANVTAAVFNYYKNNSWVFSTGSGFGNDWAGAKNYYAGFGTTVEAKYQEALAIWTAYEEAELVAPAGPAFPEVGKAYVIFHPEANLYLNIVADAAKAARLTAEPEKIFFEKKGDGFLIKDEEGNMVGGHANDWNVSSTIEQTWNIVEVEGGYALQRTDATSKYIGFDKIVVNPDDASATAAFRDKNYATGHGVFNIFEYTFPLQHTAYKVKNVDAGLYMNITSADAKNVTIEKTPEKIYFTLAENGGFYIQDADGNYAGAGANDWTVANTSATWNVVEVEGGYAFQRTDAPSKYLGLDSVNESSAYFRDKGAAAHYAHIIMLFDTPETTPAEDLAAAIEEAKKVTAAEYANVPADLFEDLAAVIEKAKDFANEDAAVSDINDQLAALEAAVNAIKNYVPETPAQLLARLQAAVAAGKTIVAQNTVGGVNKAGQPGYKPANLVEAVAADVEAYDGATEVTRDEVVAVEHNVKYYNEALPCIPEVGKTYVIRNHPTHFSDIYSYVITAGENGRELIPYSQINTEEIEGKYLWTVSEHEFKVEDDWGDLLFSETRYVFTNVATGQIFGYDGAKLDLCANETDMNCWYFTQKAPKEIFAGSSPLPYGTLGLQYNDGGNKYKFTTVDMRTTDLNISGSDVPMHALWNTYSSAFIFDVYEPEVWEGEAPTVVVEDATTVTVTFQNATKVEGTNYGVLGAIFDESGDVVSVLFDALFDDCVEYGTDCATLSFTKLSDLNAELQPAAKNVAAKALAAVGGQASGKVVILGKSFKIDGTTIYQAPIVTEFTLGGTLTGIDAATLEGQKTIFDLTGRRVREAKNGIFLLNGKKVVK